MSELTLFPLDTTLGPQWECACGFDPAAVVPLYSAAWDTAHMAAHLAAFPDLDQISRDNLASFIEGSRRLERESAIGSEAAVTPVAASDRVAEEGSAQ